MSDPPTELGKEMGKILNFEAYACEKKNIREVKAPMYVIWDDK